jgi:hypothetical protein
LWYEALQDAYFVPAFGDVNVKSVKTRTTTQVTQQQAHQKRQQLQPVPEEEEPAGPCNSNTRSHTNAQKTRRRRERTSRLPTYADQTKDAIGILIALDHLESPTIDPEDESYIGASSKTTSSTSSCSSSSSSSSSSCAYSCALPNGEAQVVPPTFDTIMIPLLPILLVVSTNGGWSLFLGTK